MTYYILILLAVGLFGGGFALNDVYRRARGESLYVSLQFTLHSSLAGLAVLLCINGLKPECTVFTLLMAISAALVGFGFTFCTFKALGSINLSLYSLFSMLGGMLLPFFQGILFYGEGVTVAKAVGSALIVLALALTVQKGEKKRGTVYYAGVFVLNGLSGVLSKLFTEAPYPKTGAAAYSALIALCTAVPAGIALLTVKKPKGTPGHTKGALLSGALNGAFNRVANYLLVVSLSHVDASLQYPMVTGGVMAVSTALSCFTGNKPSRRELAALGAAMLGLLALFLIPV